MTEADLCIVGGGFTGLWAALRAKALDPGRDVRAAGGRDAPASAASGRNGGFCSSSLTHGITNGLARFAGEMDVLERLGTENLDGLEADLARHGIECDFERTGDLAVALEPHQEAWLEEEAEVLRRFGHECELLDGPAMRAEVASPLYRGGLWNRSGTAMLDPGALAAGLRAAALAAGVRIHEHTAAAGLGGGRGGAR